jgi:hypothetical protein
LNGAIFKPQRGDLIEIVIAGATQTYEVLAPGGETPWQYCDPYQTTIRIHSKMVRTT